MKMNETPENNEMYASATSSEEAYISLRERNNRSHRRK